LRPARSARCWRSPATTAWASVAPPSVPTPCSPRSPHGHGSRSRAAPVPKVTATTTGRSSAWTTPPRSWQAGRPALAHGPPQPADRRVGLPPLLYAPPGAAGGPGPGRGEALDGGRGLPGRQGPVWPGPATGAPLALLVPVGHAGHAGLRLPGGRRPCRPHPPPTTAWADQVDLQRASAPVRGAGCSARW
jgi:hypothetical protein